MTNNVEGKSPYLPLLRSRRDKTWLPVKNCEIIHEYEAGALLEIEYFSGEYDDVYFASWDPYTLQHTQSMLDSIEFEASKNRKLFFHREIIGVSKGDIDLETVLVTSRTDHKQKATLQNSKVFAVFLARRHGCWESSSSILVESMIRYLCNTDDPIVSSLLERINFLFFPMANPDSVYDGDSKKAKDYPSFIIDALDQI